MIKPLSRWERIRLRFLRRPPKYQPSFIKTPKGNGLNFGTSSLDVRIRGAELIMGQIIDVKNKKIYTLSFSNANDVDRDAETNNFILKTRLHPDAVAPNYFLPVGEYVLLNQWFDYDTGRNGTYKDKFVIV